MVPPKSYDSCGKVYEVPVSVCCVNCMLTIILVFGSSQSSNVGKGTDGEATGVCSISDLSFSSLGSVKVQHF